VDAERAVVEVAVDVRNDGLGTETVVVEVDIEYGSGAVVASGSAPVTARAGNAAVARIRTYVREPRLWSVDNPQLYTATVRLGSADGVRDEQHTTFGVRTLRLDPVYGLRINGETVKLRGACVHHDNGILGAAAFGPAEERKAELLKAAGFNAIRSAHNPLSEAMLAACDRVGMLVIDEAFDIWTESKSSFDYSLAFQEWWERDIEAMVLKDLNHPSVIFYSIGNEIPETGSPLGSEWGRRLAEKVRSLDSTRFVTNGINGVVSTIDDAAAEFRKAAASGEENDGGVNAMMSSQRDMQNQIATSSRVTERTAESFGVLDVAGMNYADARYTLDRELFPNRIIVGTETFPPAIADNWALILDSPHVIGDFTWTGFDYLGEVGIGRPRYTDDQPAFAAPFPWIAAWCGDLDITGYRRPASYYREIVFGLRTEPYLAVQRPENYERTPAARNGWSWTDSIASWTWAVEPGTPIRVEVYSGHGDEEVELVLDGKTLVRRPVGSGADLPLVTIFETEYQPGELTAVTYRNGRESGRTTLRSADGATRLTAAADRDVLVADDADLAFISIELRDPAGTLVTSEDRRVAVSVEGAGVLQALGSARPDNAERYDAGEHTTFDGRALAVVRPTGAGAITVTVTADGLEPVALTLTAERH
jgi:beta-galactosidase